jgi:class 3 adenylate cyclase
MWGAAMDLGRWLRGLGLDQYEVKFRDNRIDGDILPQLTADDLKDIGVAAVGDRRRLIAAIAALAATPSTPASAGDVAADLGGRTARETSAERRQLTVMFSDLVGSTALSARLDPEDMRAVIAAYQKAVDGAVRQEDGFIAKYMGDGVLAYFGYPQAHEDDAERAVRAGLATIEAIARLDNAVGVRLEARVGVATGIVVVGDLVGSGESSERGVVGDTPNLAARLQGVAEPGRVVIAEATRRLVGDLFELEDVGPQELKGISATRAFAVLQARPVASRFEALHAGGLTALVGREEEIEILLRRWAKAKSGEGQIVHLSGEAGIGKSRLTAALMERLVDEPHHRLRFYCSPQHVDSALSPIIGQMERGAGFARDDNIKAKLDKLDAMLARTATTPEDASLLADILGLQNDGRYPTVEIAPQVHRKKALAAIVGQIEAGSSQRPVLLVFEDAHWADSSSLETLSLIFDRIERLKALALVTFRSDFAPPWTGGSQVTTLTLNRLTRRETEVLVDGVAGNKPLTESVRRDIVERADGVPLFAEEIAKAAIEAEDEGRASRLVSAIPSSAQAVPASLHASLMARLDRLGPAKDIAQIGAGIGREFSFELIAAVSAKSESVLAPMLDRLVQSGLLFQQGAPPHATYLFKHSLVQDAAYGTLLREPRRALHARIAEALERQFPDTAKSQPEILASHCEEAGLLEKAAHLWGQAGQQWLARSALVEAVEHLKHALKLIERLPGSPGLRREEISLQIALMTSLYSVKGKGSRGARAAPV